MYSLDCSLIASLEERFPDPGAASPEGLLAYGGSLDPHFLIAAYRRGIFPWYNAGQPILWWSPDPRCVLYPQEFHVTRRSSRKLKTFTITVDRRFSEVIASCAEIHKEGTWITPDIRMAYTRLHELGVAHSVEAWKEGQLAGGLYGVAIGRVFFGESMFHRESEASRSALAALVALLTERGFSLIDCQQVTPHMLAMGAKPVQRADFLTMLGHFLPDAGSWQSQW